MKKIINFTYVLISTLLLFSCSEVLELEPQQSISLEAAVSSEANLKSLLIGSYSDLGAEQRTGSNASLSGTSQIISDLLGNTGELSWTGTFVGPRQLNNKSVLADNNFITRIWTADYKTINQTNLILDNLSIVADSDDREKMEGESKFLRAFAYFDLIRVFAKQYKFGITNSQPGVPIRLIGVTNFKSDLSVSRSSVEEVYTQIIKDLNDAYNLLPNSNSFFANKYAAKALLARVYLQQQDYLKARDAANVVIEESGNELAESYSKVFNNDNNSSEDIFAFQITDQTGTNRFITFYATEENGGRGGDITVNDSFTNSFDSTSDVRSSFLEGGLTNKYTNQFANISVLRLAEMYLIRAECNFRENTNVGDTPLNDINKIRNRALADELTSIDLETILRERNFELAFEGFKLNDLKRTERNIGSLSYDSDQLVMPIPQVEMDSNTKIEQNPGYSN